MKQFIKTRRPAALAVTCQVCLAAIFIFPFAAFGKMEYVFKRMWPTMQHPWYFYNPSGICVDPDGFVYIANTKNDEIVKFTADGHLVARWGKEGDDQAQFRDPYDIAADCDGHVYVSDAHNHRVQKFTTDGVFVSQWGKLGNKSGQFDLPQGVAVDRLNFVYVADAQNNRVQKFTEDGQFVAEFDGVKERNDGFNCPGDVAASNENQIFVADTDNHQIVEMTPDGRVVNRWGEQGNAAEQFIYPNALALDSQNHVYVSDLLNHRVQKFDSAGNFLKAWGESGFRDGQFNQTRGLAVDKEGVYLYAVDKANHRIQKFTTQGRFVARWGSGGEKGDLNTPKAIAISNDENIYVMDTGNHRVQKFDANGVFQIAWGGYGKEESQFIRPWGIAVDAKGRVYVADTFNERIQRFDADGTFDRQWGETGVSGEAEGLFNQPAGVAVNSQNHVFVVDQNNQRIQILTNGAEAFQEWQTYPNLFDIPFGIAVDREDRVYVSDTGNNAVYQFDAKGILLKTWDKNDGSGEHDFDIPYGVATGNVDGQDHVYVADSGNHRILKFQTDGTRVATLGEFGHYPSQFSYPRDLAVGSHGNLYVADTDNHRVQVFEPMDRPLQKAILVAGGGPYDGNKLWDATRSLANQAHWTLTYQGINPDNICYLSHDFKIDKNTGNSGGDIDGVPLRNELSEAITVWAADADMLILYMVDHGGTNIFRLNDHQMLTADELYGWLDQRQSPHPSKTVIVVIDACASGSFVDSPLLSNHDGIIISSSAGNENAHFISQGAVSFSGLFWPRIFSGFSVNQAFLTAREILEDCKLQTPWMKTMGNIDLEQIRIGNGTDNHNPGFWIDDLHVVQDAERLHVIVPDAEDKDGFARVWAVIHPENKLSISPDVPILDFPEIELTPAGQGGHKGIIRRNSLVRDSVIAIYATDRMGNMSFPKFITPASDSDPDARSKALLATGFFPSKGLAPDVNQILHILKSQGFKPEDIIVFNMEDQWTSENLQSELKKFESSAVDDFIFYVAATGEKQGFLSGNGDFINIADLDDWLNALQEKISGRLILIFDTDWAGDFLPFLGLPESNRRIVIAGTGKDRKALFQSDQGVSFSKFFFQEIFNGRDVKYAFKMAQNAIRFLTGNSEDALPILDTDGNGVGNEREDMAAAAGVVIGNGIERGTNSPIIADQPDSTILDGEASFNLLVEHVTSSRQITNVWAFITPPQRQNPAQSSDSNPTIILLTPDGNGGYAKEYSGFDIFGSHNVSILAKDDAGRNAVRKSFTIYQSQGPDVYEPDNNLNQASQIIVNAKTPQWRSLHCSTDEDWIMFHAISEKTYTIRVHPQIPPGPIHLEMFGDDGTSYVDQEFSPAPGSYETLDWTCPINGVYRVKIESAANDLSEKTTGYGIEIYQPIGEITGCIKGKVMDKASSTPIPGALVLLMDDFGTQGSCVSDSEGEYLMIYASGTYQMKISNDGYQSLCKSVIIGEGNISVLDLPLVSLAGGNARNAPEDDCLENANDGETTKTSESVLQTDDSTGGSGGSCFIRAANVGL